MDDKEYIGSPGRIDTQAERNALEYRPKVNYAPERPFTVNLEPEIVSTTPVQEVGPGAKPNPIEKPSLQYLQFVGASTFLDSIIAEVEKELNDKIIPISGVQAGKLIESSPRFAPILLPDGGISFEAYKNSFGDPEEPGNSYLQDIVHSYASDVEGDLELEVYEDLMELKAGLLEGYFLFRESVLKEIAGDAPELPEQNEDYLKRLEEAASSQRAAAEHLQKVYESKEGGYYESLRTEYGSPEFFQKSEEYLNAKRPYDLEIRNKNHMEEMMSLIEHFLNGTNECASRIKSGLVLGSDIDEKEVMKVLANQASTKEQLADLMKLTQISLKLQVNKQIEDKKQYRDVLKNINNLSRKKRAHDELLMAYQLRKKMYLNMYDTLQHLESPSKKPGVETFLNQIAGGLSLIQEQYDTFLNDIYMMNVSEYEVRREKLEKTMEKENARAGYSLVLEHL